MVLRLVGGWSTGDILCRHNQRPARKMVQIGVFVVTAITSPSWLLKLCRLSVAYMLWFRQCSALQGRPQTFLLSQMAFSRFPPKY